MCPPEPRIIFAAVGYLSCQYARHASPSLHPFNGRPVFHFILPLDVGVRLPTSPYDPHSRSFRSPDCLSMSATLSLASCQLRRCILGAVRLRVYLSQQARRVIGSGEIVVMVLWAIVSPWIHELASRCRPHCRAYRSAGTRLRRCSLSGDK